MGPEESGLWCGRCRVNTWGALKEGPFKAESSWGLGGEAGVSVSAELRGLYYYNSCAYSLQAWTITSFTFPGRVCTPPSRQASLLGFPEHPSRRNTVHSPAGGGPKAQSSVLVKKIPAFHRDFVNARPWVYVCQELEFSFLVGKYFPNLFLFLGYSISAEQDTQLQAYKVGNGVWGVGWIPPVSEEAGPASEVLILPQRCFPPWQHCVHPGAGLLYLVWLLGWGLFSLPEFLGEHIRLNC